MSFSKVISDFIDIDDAKDFAAGAVESVTGTLDMMDIPRNYLMSQVGMQPPGTYTDAARDALNLQPNTESSAYMAGQIVGGAATGGAGAIRQAGKQGLQYATREAGKQLGYEGLATAGSEVGAQAGQYLGGDTGEFVGSLAGGAVTGGAGQALGNPNKMDIIGGTRSDTIDPMMVDMAVRMENAGHLRQSIYRNTGLYRGADGNWRFEIDDSQMDFAPFDRNQAGQLRPAYSVVKHDELYRAYPDMAEMDVGAMTEAQMRENPGVQGYFSPSRDEIRVNPRLSPEEQRSTVMHEMQHAVQEREGHSGGASPEGAMQYANDSYFKRRRMLLESLPGDVEMKDVSGAKLNAEYHQSRITPLAEVETLLSMYNISQPKQLFNSSLYYKYSDQVRSIIGPPPRRGQRSIEYAQEAGEVIAKLERLRLQNDATRSGMALSDYVERRLAKTGTDRGALDEARKELRSLRGKRDRLRDKFKLDEFNNLKRRHDDMKTAYGPYGVYRHTEGEAESFNTEKRMNMTPAERRASFPTSTIRGSFVTTDPEFANQLDSSYLIPEESGLRRAALYDGGVADMFRKEGIFRGFDDASER
jgi:hypothetical protein